MDKIKLKLVDNSLPLPAYQTPGSVAFDLYSRIDLKIAPQTLEYIPTNLIIKTPPGYMLLISLRSSTPKRKGLLIPNGIGVIDQDFCGPDDEIKLIVFNFTKEFVKIERNERIGQGMFVRIDKCEFEEILEIEDKNRGGIGSTKF